MILGGVLGGYMAMGGHMEVLFQPFEVLIILGAAAGAFIGNSLANKFQRAPAGNAAAQRVRTQYYQAQPHRGNPVQTPNTLREQPKSQANNPNYRQIQKAPANQRAPVRRNGFRRR